MDEHITISTPEQVAFQYEVAGIGSRFVAALVDHLILMLVVILVFCGAFAVTTAAGVGSIMTGDEEAGGAYWVLAVYVLLIFLILWGYFIIFETVWRGQTPGKRMHGLRVIRRDGQPISAGEAMVRNLVRLVDVMPGFYGIGLVVMFADQQTRRLGDFAASTIVVREGEETRLRDVRVPTPSTPAYTPPSSAAYSPLTPQPSVPGTRPDPLPGVSLRELTAADYQLIREMLARARRGELSRERGQELAYQMAFGVAQRLGHDFREWQARGWEPMVFLESVLVAKEVRGE